MPPPPPPPRLVALFLPLPGPPLYSWLVSCAGSAACHSRQAPQAAQAAAAGGPSWPGPPPLPGGPHEGLLAPCKAPAVGCLSNDTLFPPPPPAPPPPPRSPCFWQFASMLYCPQKYTKMYAQVSLLDVDSTVFWFCPISMLKEKRTSSIAYLVS